MNLNVGSLGAQAKRNEIVARTLDWWDQNRRNLRLARGAGRNA